MRCQMSRGRSRIGVLVGCGGEPLRFGGCGGGP